MPDKVPAPIKLAILKRGKEITKKKKPIVIIIIKTDCNKHYKGKNGVL